MTTRSIFKTRVAAIMVFLSLSIATRAQNVAITDDNAYSADVSAMLDIKATTKGLLIPRVALLSTTNPISGTKPDGLLVWNTSTSGTYNKVGFYFWSTTANDWKMVGDISVFSNGLTQTGNSIKLGGSLVETTTITQGNYGMVHNLNGTGDFDVQDNGGSYLFVGDNGLVGIGNNNPAQKLDVAGNVKIGDNIMVEGSSTYKVYRNLATYSANTTTGAIVITTNQPANNYMFVIKVSGYLWTSAGPYDLTVKGYATSGSYSYTGYVSLGPDNLRVRLGFNGSNIVLIIGDEATSYSYPKFTVTHFYQGLSTANEAYADGWTISQQTSLTAYTGVVDVTRASTIDLSNYYNKSEVDGIQTTLQNNINTENLWDRSGSVTLLKNSADKVGIGTGSPLSALHISSANANTTGTDGSLIDIQNNLTTINTMSGIRFTANDVSYPKAGIFFQRKTSTYGLGNLIFAMNNVLGSSTVTAADADLIINQKGDVGIGIGNDDPTSRLTVKGSSSTDINAPLFEVKNNSGQTVFAVYSEGVRIWVNDDPPPPGKATGSRGGFAVGGISSSKGITDEYLRVTPDSVRVYVDTLTASKATGSRGGFAVGGISSSKGGLDDWMRLSTKNYFIGHKSGTKTTTGTYNTFFGYQAGFYNTTGIKNIYLGYQSGFSASVDQNNVFIGVSAGYKNKGSTDWTGDDNIFIGNNAGYENITGHDNVYLGNNAGKTNTKTYNVAIGSDAGKSSTSGFNTFVGNSAGQSSTGDGNTYIGMGAGIYNTTGASNVYLGSRAGFWNTSGNSNVLIGYGAGELASGQAFGSNNIFIGYEAGNAQVNVSNKLIIESSDSPSPLIYGDFAAKTLKINGKLTNYALTGSSSITLDGAALTGTTNELVFNEGGAYKAAFGYQTTDGYVFLYEGSRNSFVSKGGNIGINTITPGAQLDVIGNTEITGSLGVNVPATSSKSISALATGTGTTCGVYGSATTGTSNRGVYGNAPTASGYAGYFTGNVYVTGTVSKSSDARLKNDIEPISGALTKLNQINGVSYNWKSHDELQLLYSNIKSELDSLEIDNRTNMSSERQIGVIAQEVEKVLPELVITDEMGFKSVNYEGLIPILIEAIKEQQKQIDELKTQLGNK